MNRRTYQITLDADLVDELHSLLAPIGEGTTKTECVASAIRRTVQMERCMARQNRRRREREAEAGKS